MDKRLEQALDFSNFRMILTTRQENLKVLMNNKLMLSYGGGLFKVDKELLTFVGLYLLGGDKELILIDENDIPIKIEDLKDFAVRATTQYEKALEQYYNSYQKLSEARDIRKVIDWDEETKEK
jgi:hypothetical protein